MKVLFIVGSFPLYDSDSRGVFVKKVYLEMKNLGHECSVLCPTSSFKIFIKGLSKRGESIIRPFFISFGVRRLFGMDLSSLTLFSFSFSVFLGNKFLIRDFKPDVVYSHFIYPSGLALSMLKREFNGARLVCVAGESSLEHFRDRTGRLERLTYLNVLDLLVFNSNFSKENFNLLRPDLSVVQKCIPNAVGDRLVFSIEDLKLVKETLRMDPNDVVVIFIGGFIERKGAQRVLDAVRKLPRTYKCIFLGKGAELESDQRILFREEVGEFEVAKYLSISDCFVMPSRAEGMSNALLEALSYGVRPVVSRIPPNVEVLGEDYPYYCSTDDIDDISSKIQLCVNSLNLDLPYPMLIKERVQAILGT